MPRLLLPFILCGAFLSASGQTFDEYAELPRTTMEVRESFTVSQNIPLYVPANVPNLQTVLNSARPGDVIVIDAAFTATLSGLVLPDGTPSEWITIKSSAEPLLPSEQNRISPAFAGVTSLPGRSAYVQPTGGAAKLMPRIILTNQNSSITGGSYVRLIGFEITRITGTGIVYNLLRGLGHDIIIDRCWIHGTAGDETTRGVYLSNSSSVAVINSYFNDFHCRSISGSCTDAQAVAGGTDTVQSSSYLIQNNYLEASGEAVLFGGGVATSIPTDITVISNDFFKPMTWNPLDSSYDGGTAGKDGIKHPWIVKNHFELKNGTRVLFEGNRLQNVWGNFSQVGAAILVTPKNQSAGTAAAPIAQCPICAVTNVTIRYNYASYAAQALQLGCGPNDYGAWPAGCGNNSIHDNVFDHLQYSTCYGCTSFLNSMGGGGITPNQNVSVVQNTFKVDGWLSPPMYSAASTASGVLLVNAPPSGVHGFHFDNNVFDPGNNGIYSTGGGADNCFTSLPGPVGTNSIKNMIAKCWIDGGSMTGNQINYTLPFNPGRLPWPDGNGPANPLAGANMTTLNTAIARRR